MVLIALRDIAPGDEVTISYDTSIGRFLIS
jgi:SET domain-containing protein